MDEPKEYSWKNNFIEVDHINGYLISAPDIYVMKRATPFFNVPPMIHGNVPVDDGNFLLNSEERDELIKKNPRAEKWIRPFVGSREFINRISRFCLWLKDCPPDELRKMPLVYERVKNVREFRAEIRQPTENYLIVPRVSSSRRRYIPMGFLTPDVIAGDACQFIPNADLFLFGVLTSSVHMNWVRLVCGRLKSDYRYSNTICYNPFPFPLFYSEAQKQKIAESAQKILDARKNYPNATYADLYDEISMPYDLRKAHAENDLEVLKAYHLPPDMDEETMQITLLKSYQTLHEEFDDADEE